MSLEAEINRLPSVIMSSQTVLVTGATGFIGGAAMVRLLLEHPSCRVLALVRAASEDAAWAPR